MGKARVAGAKRPIGWLGWTIRILGGTVLTVALALAGYVIYFTLAVYPKLVAESTAKAQKAEAFARLTGTARRLAIYDAFVAQIDSQYYDQTFAGMDWPKMKQDWRVKAASVDDNALYSDVLFQMTQRFPTSHVSVIWPGVATPGYAAKASESSSAVPESSPDQPKFGGDKDLGFQIVKLRRRGGTGFVVGEVWPGSAAEKAALRPDGKSTQLLLILSREIPLLKSTHPAHSPVSPQIKSTPSRPQARHSFFFLTPAFRKRP